MKSKYRFSFSAFRKCFTEVSFRGLVALLFVNALGGAAFAVPCAHPKLSPQLSFTLLSTRPGDLDITCKAAVKSALALGFDAVTLVPTRVFDGRDAIADGTTSSEEITRCLDVIWNSGLNLVYQPHLESDQIIYPDHPIIWRAHFDFKPGASYEELFFAPLLTWLQKHQSELSQGKRQVSITVAAELETSTTRYGSEWFDLVNWLRRHLVQMNLRNQVPVGYNPNWWPMPAFKDQAGCDGFRQFIRSLDYVSPSFYGNWSNMYYPFSQIPQGQKQVDGLKSQLLQRMAYYPASHCSVPEFMGKTFSIGEFGIGGNFEHTEDGNQWPLTLKSGFVPKRRAVYYNILDWARHQVGSRFSATINVWTSGVFDPVGVVRFPDDHIVADGALIDMFRQYSRWRCQP